MAEVIEVEDNLALRIKLIKERELRRKSHNNASAERKKISASLRKTNMSSGLSSESKKLELGIPAE